MKKILFAVATFCLFLGSASSAAPISLEDFTSPITVGDKTFTPLGFSLSTSVNAFVEIQLSGDPHTGTYSFNVGGLGSVTGGLNGEIRYSVTINDPGWYFDVIGVDVTHNSNTSAVTKDVFTDSGFSNLLGTLSSTNGVPGSSINVASGNYTTLFIRDTTVLDASGSISGYSNTFRQTGTAVPEPGSLTLAGCAALGLVGIAWRRRRSLKS